MIDTRNEIYKYLDDCYRNYHRNKRLELKAKEMKEKYKAEYIRLGKVLKQIDEELS